MTVSNQPHFDAIASRYSKASDTWSSIYQQIEHAIAPLITNKRVLDIGNGGYFPYNPRLASEVVVVDISPEMLEQMKEKHVTKIVDDATKLNRIPNESFDISLYILCVHHINGKTHAEARQTLNVICQKAFQKLKRGGTIIIAEPTMNGLLQVIEKAAYPLTRTTLNLFKVPMIYFHSAQTIQSALATTFQSQIQTQYLKIDGWVDPLGGSFPGLLKIPASLCPTQYHLFSTQKK